MKIRLITNYERFDADYKELIRAFAPHLELDDAGKELRLIGTQVGAWEYQFTIKYDSIEKTYCENICNSDEFITEVKEKSLLKRYSKIALYRFLSDLTGVNLPYGSLTGIRPTKLYHDLSRGGIDADTYFTDVLGVSAQKTKSVKAICRNQAPYYDVSEREVDVFVNIPICVSRCSYCSFLSAQLSHVRKSVEPYCDLLCRELEHAKALIRRQGLSLRAIYVGGGTPTSLDADQLFRVLNACRAECREFTVEAGRPDTITREKLDVMARCGVDRISINPQTFHAATLEKIGRRHSTDDIYRVYEWARKYDFKINMDLIAMLPDETAEMFAYSVDCALALDPDNITVHSLALKRGSVLKESGYARYDADLPMQMIDYSDRAICARGYGPYYMYKQKYMSGNLENTGYCKPGAACVYNIDIMEETASILANGAGGISKRVWDHGAKIERLANPKGLDVYLARGDENMERKERFWADNASESCE